MNKAELLDVVAKAMRVLRNRDGGLELKPEGFAAYRFGDTVTAFDVAAEMMQRRTR